MKKIMVLLGVILSVLTSFAQTNCIAYRTEVYEWEKEMWVYKSSNMGIAIPLVTIKNFIHIKTKTDDYFLLNGESEKISGHNFVGFRHVGYNLRTEEKVVVDVIAMSNPTESCISIIYVDKNYNIRYYMRQN